MSARDMDFSSQQSDWRPYQPTSSQPWDLERVVHLHRRAGFAAPWPVLQRDLQDGLAAAVDRLLAGEQTVEHAPANFEALARTIGDAAVASDNASRLKAWWMFRMLMSLDPLGERLALMWHNHFATSNRKVQNLILMRQQNELFRRHARSGFADLLAAVVKHPAMLMWLDADSNRKGHPNENLARELMELFTLGIGHYTERDVREAARALTGCRVDHAEFAVRAEHHDDGEKLVLSKRGRFTPDGLLDLLLEHPATARRLAWRLCRTFMGEGVVSERALEQLAAGLTKRELDVSWAISTVLRSQLFFSADNMRSRVIGPVEFVVGAVRALQLCDRPPSTLMLAEWAARMGQDLFYPPNVGGWKEGRTWLASRTIIARTNFAGALVDGRLWMPIRQPDFQQLLSSQGGIDGTEGSNATEGTAWLANLLWGGAPKSVVQEITHAMESARPERRVSVAVALLLARPEYQLA